MQEHAVGDWVHWIAHLSWKCWESNLWPSPSSSEGFLTGWKEYFFEYQPLITVFCPKSSAIQNIFYTLKVLVKEMHWDMIHRRKWDDWNQKKPCPCKEFIASSTTSSRTITVCLHGESATLLQTHLKFILLANHSVNTFCLSAVCLMQIQVC